MPYARLRWLRPLLLLYPLAMVLALMATGEHYFFDVALGWVYAAAVMAGAGLVGAAGSGRLTPHPRVHPERMLRGLPDAPEWRTRKRLSRQLQGLQSA